MRRAGINVQSIAAEAQKDIGDKEGEAFVAVDKRVVQEQRLHERGRHLRQVLIVAALRTVKGAVEQTQIARAVTAAESVN